MQILHGSKLARFLWLGAGLSLAFHVGVFLQPYLNFDFQKPTGEKQTLTLTMAMAPPETPLKKSNVGASKAPAASTISRQTPAAKASQVLADPRLGEIFAKYFEAIKKDIMLTASSYESSGRGMSNMLVHFVIKRDGTLASLRILNEVSSKKERSLDALSIVRQTGPFRPFPKDIPHEAISFQVTLRFES